MNDINSMLMKIGRFLSKIILPPVCSGCRLPMSESYGLCGSCWSRLTFIERPYCERLGIPFPYDIVETEFSLIDNMVHSFSFNKVRSAVCYDEIARDLVHNLKYWDRTDLVPFMGRLMTRVGQDLFHSADMLIPIPLHRRRFLRRRFNQSTLLAQKISRITKIPCKVNLLTRFHSGVQQVHLKSRDRYCNIENAFSISKIYYPYFKNRCIVLIDDVITTGATVNSAAQALLQAGTHRVDVLTFARVILK